MAPGCLSVPGHRQRHFRWLVIGRFDDLVRGYAADVAGSSRRGIHSVAVIWTLYQHSTDRGRRADHVLNARQREKIH